MEKVIVLGIGNVLMMDDGIGIYLIEQLSRLNRPAHVSFVIGESDIDYCLGQIMDVDFVIILDAVLSGSKPGELTIYPLANLHEYQNLDLSAHNAHLFQTLHQQKETIKGYLIGIEPYEINFHIGLSKTLTKQWETILHETSKTIDKLTALYGA